MKYEKQKLKYLKFRLISARILRLINLGILALMIFSAIALFKEPVWGGFALLINFLAYFFIDHIYKLFVVKE